MASAVDLDMPVGAAVAFSYLGTIHRGVPGDRGDEPRVLVLEQPGKEAPVPEGFQPSGFQCFSLRALR